MREAPVAIVGSGIAGLWTALHAAPLPVVLLAGNSLGGDSSTGWAQGGIAAALGDDDSPQLHADDTIAAGVGLSDEAAAWLLAEAAPDEVRTLEALRGDGAELVDRQGRRFMPELHPDAELAPRDVVARAVHRQIASGKGALLDATRAVGKAFPERFPTVYQACTAAGIDPRTQAIPVAPAEHYHMGGVATDSDGFSEIPGLYVVGEAGCTGVHGANQLASNSLLDALVTGRRAALRIRGTDPDLHRATGPAEKPAPALAAHTLRRLREAMRRHVGVERAGNGLQALLETIDAMTLEHGPADELVAARFIAAGALLREESRGAHARTDFPGLTAPVTHTELNLERLDETLPLKARKQGAA